jgi:tetrahydromethanopterin S-methyltransferase subunit D
MNVTAMVNSKKIILTLLFIGIVGTVLFFPVKMDSGYTCIFHNICRINAAPCSDGVPGDRNCSLMQRQYLIPFGFAWWISLAILAIGIYNINKLKKKG